MLPGQVVLVALVVAVAGQPAVPAAGDAAAGHAAAGAPRDTPSSSLPPVAVWGDATEVDEPSSAFDSLGRTLWHFGRNAGLIGRFHADLRGQGIEPTSLLAASVVPPADTRRILLEPELVPDSGWVVRGDLIDGGAGERGPEARLPLRIDRGGLYRGWVRYTGYAEGAAVSSLTITAAAGDPDVPLLNEEFHTLVAGADGPCWHEFMVDLEPGDHVVALGSVVNYHHTDKKVPRKKREVHCIYLTDEIWRPAPDDEELAALTARIEAEGGQRTDAPPLAAADIWRLWQVRPCDWEAAPRHPRLFALSYAFWRREIDALAAADMQAPPLDPVARGVADFRDPRRQVIFDPVWNMVGNPHRIRTQREILAGDIDPLATDATFEFLLPGEFPVVQGQWQRAGGGLSADHAARQGLAAGTYTVPHPGPWHLWVMFKNINYHEHFGVHVDTAFGRAATWERTERLYPGGRYTWAKVGTVDVPPLTDAETEAHRAAAARGVFVEDGRPTFAIAVGDWNEAAGWIEAGGTESRLAAKAALPATGDFHVRARLSLTDHAESEAAFAFAESNGVLDNRVLFTGSATGAAFGKDGPLAVDTAAIRAGEPFDFEFVRQGDRGTILIDGKQAAQFTFADPPGGSFQFQPGGATMRVHAFAATGDLADGLEALRRIRIALWMKGYVNPRTFRGVSKLFITDDAAYQPEGGLLPKPTPARFRSMLEAAGMEPDDGYVLAAAPGIGLINQTWMPGTSPREPVVELALARDTVRSASLMFRNGSEESLALTIAPGPLVGGGQRFPGAVRWRAVAFAPYGQGREAWSPFFLLRRPFLMLPPRGPAQAWLTIDTTGVPPGDYESRIVIAAHDKAEQDQAEQDQAEHGHPERTAILRVRVSPVRVAPQQPILVHGWVKPPPGEVYKRDWFQRINVWQGPLMSKEEMRERGVALQIVPQWNANAAQIRKTIDTAQAKGLGYDDWMFSVMDEPTGLTADKLKPHIAIATLIRAADPQVRITMNPGEAARAATFKILQPYVDLWNPYVLHLSYGPSGRGYLEKPWLWYTTPCYGDKSPGLARDISKQVRSVLAQPGECRGTAFFAPYYPWRDPWDTAHEHIKDVSAFVLPSRHGPVATPTWEALREAVQHANLARMVRERAAPDDAAAKALWESGDVDPILRWLETHPAK